MKSQWNRSTRPSVTRFGLYARLPSCIALLILTVIFAGGSSCGTSPLPGITPGGATGGATGSNSGGSSGGTLSETQLPILPGDHVIGDPSAKIIVVEYGDFQCPCCGRFARQDFPTIRSKYIDTGKILWVFRHFPLRSIHPRAEPAAEAAECAAAQVDFFDFELLTYGTVDSNGAAILTDAQLQQNAVSLGANLTSFKSCTTGGSMAAHVQQDLDSGIKLGVGGTPAFFVGTEMFPPAGSATCATAALLSDVIDKHLAN
jgi:protein-disulfide isomerase